MVARILPPELSAAEWRELGLDPDDPFRYGWRYAIHEQPDSEIVPARIPLTLEDVLHPQEEDFIVQDEEHIDWCRYLQTVLRHLLAHVPLAVVFQDQLFLWDVPGMKGLGPDIAVVFGVRPGRRRSFDVATESARPALVIEITSPTTAKLDRQSKLEEYHLAGVEFYIIIERRFVQRRRTLHLLGYRATPVGYEPLIPNERGWLWMEPVHGWLGIADDKPVCFTEAGEPLGDYGQIAAERDAARSRAEAERQRAEAERQRAETEAAARLAAEERAKATEARLRELEAALRRAQGGR